MADPFTDPMNGPTAGPGFQPQLATPSELLAASVAEPVAEMENLSIRWGPKPVLDGLNLRVAAGERLVVVGPSGAGKSTILRLLAGLLLPTAGSLRIHGIPQTYLRLDQRRPPDVRLVFQNPALLASLTVRENVGFVLYRYSGLPDAEIRRRVSRALAAVGLYGIEERLPGELSGGMQKRVSFARALIEDPTAEHGPAPLLLFDEPTAGLDPVACTRVEDLIVRSTELTNAAGVVVSHVLSTIERCAQRVILLYGGRFRWDGTLNDFRHTDNPYVRQFRSGSLEGPMQPNEP